MQIKRYDDALKLFRETASAPEQQAEGMTDLAYVYARTERRAEAQKPLDELREMYSRGDLGDRHITGNANAYFIAQVYVELGDSVRRPKIFRRPGLEFRAMMLLIWQLAIDNLESRLVERFLL